MTQHINTFQSFNIDQVKAHCNDWMKRMERAQIGFVAINVSLSQSVDTCTNMVQYSLAILYGVSSPYTTDELK